MALLFITLTPTLLLCLLLHLWLPIIVARNCNCIASDRQPLSQHCKWSLQLQAAKLICIDDILSSLPSLALQLNARHLYAHSSVPDISHKKAVDISVIEATFICSPCNGTENGQFDAVQGENPLLLQHFQDSSRAAEGQNMLSG